ncbi:MAG: hypothetical protein MUF54_03995 [Polyangiaceae bacterium]|nr:hypothetical protein [Polyangiaceae bacterium]
MGSQVHRIAADLFERVVKPLVAGGQLSPPEPIGPDDALPVAESLAANSRTSTHACWVDVARVRRARLLVPIDTLPWVGRDEALMAVMLNDMLLGVDPELGSLLAPKRCQHVLDGVLRMLGTSGEQPMLGPPATLGDALVRHATFGMLWSLQRTDTKVTWWCGGAKFAGRRPPSRLMLWPRVRRVASRTDAVTLADMAGEHAELQARMAACMQGLMRLTPLTDLAAAGRTQPPFVWSGPLQALLLTHEGYTLATRAARAEWSDRTMPALKKAAAGLSASPAVRSAMKCFLQELESMTGVA